mmetsp:Transcript_88892/g.167509  ORF Transcript_88892/g.167509 Transcript_88892/m.167509 type:complete len:402 (+) Transcript_88892:40-1245(+)
MGVAACCVGRPDEAEVAVRTVGSHSSSSDSPLGQVPFSEVDELELEGSGDNEELEWTIVEDSISPAEFSQLQLLRQAVTDLDDHPACQSQPWSRQAQTLLRFLRARPGDVKAAEAMLRDYLDWRKSFKVEDKVRRWREELREGSTARSLMYFKYGTEVEICRDKYGIPVILMRMSVTDVAGMVREMGKEALLIASLNRLEHTHALLRRAMFRWRRVFPGQVQIIDVGDYGKFGVPNWWRRMWDATQLGPSFYKVFDAYYPETARKVFVIRAGVLTYNLYNVVSPIIPPRTKKKLGLYGQRAKQWSAKLQDELLEGADVPEFLLSDSEAAFAKATPKGGFVPDGFIMQRPHDGRHSGKKVRDKAPKLQSSCMVPMVAVAMAVAVFTASVTVLYLDGSRLVTV